MLIKTKSILKIIFYISFGILVLTFFFLSLQSVFAQSEEQLKAELAKTEQEIREEEARLNQQKAKSNIIQGEVNKLTSQINVVQKNIDAKATDIKILAQDISVKDQTVTQLNQKLDRSMDILADLVRTKNKADDVSLVEVILTYDNFSDFFEGVDSVVSVQNSLKSLFGQIRELRGLTEEEKIKLEEKRLRDLEAKAVIEAEKNQVAVKQGEQKNLLAASKATEQAHAKALAEKQAKANSIRTALFALRDTTNITFEQAQTLAEAASKATGVRTAFILGILRQETNIGQYLGSCVITDLESAAMKHVTSGKVFANGIHPTRDLPTLKTLLNTLGRDPLTTRVSCPQEFGYGGAMGPSQFIPSTWLLYVPRLQQIFGTYPDPWNAQHAIMGTALLLKDNGAVAGDLVSEKNAACRYFSGSACGDRAHVLSYGNSVMSHAATFQSSIDFLATLD